MRPVPSVDSTLQSTFDRMAPAGHPLSDPLAVFVGDLEASAAGTSLAQELASDASVTSSLEEQLRRAAALEASAEGPPVEDAVAAAPAAAAAAAPAPTCDKAAVVGELFQLWGSGKLDAAATERLTSSDVVVDAKDGHEWTHAKDGYIVYSGRDGFAAWLKFLTGIQFPDFAVHKMAENAAGTVDVAVSYTPTVIATGKSAAKTMEDSHEWEVDAASCKVTKVLFHWGDAAALDALFEAPPPAPEPSPLPSPSPAAAAEEPGSGDSATVESPEPAALEPVPVPAPVGGARPVTTVVDILADLEAAATAAPEPSPSPGRRPRRSRRPAVAGGGDDGGAAAEPSPEPAAPGGARPVAPLRRSRRRSRRRRPRRRSRRRRPRRWWRPRCSSCSSSRCRCRRRAARARPPPSSTSLPISTANRSEALSSRREHLYNPLPPPQPATPARRSAMTYVCLR